VVDEVVVNLGLSGDVNVDLRLAALTEDVDDVEVLRKTRAGGNWLTGGILRMCRCREDQLCILVGSSDDVFNILYVSVVNVIYSLQMKCEMPHTYIPPPPSSESRVWSHHPSSQRLCGISACFGMSGYDLLRSGTQV